MSVCIIACNVKCVNMHVGVRRAAYNMRTELYDIKKENLACFILDALMLFDLKLIHLCCSALEIPTSLEKGK